MIDISLENINTFQSAFTEEKESTSLESFLENTGIVINTIDDFLKARQSLKVVMCNQPTVDGGTHPNPVMKFVKQGDADKYLVIVDSNLISAFIMDDTRVITEFIRALTEIPSTATLLITPYLMENDISIWMMYDGIGVLNLLSSMPCKKVLNFGAQLSIVDLLVGSYCDDVVVSRYAGVSIPKASVGASIPRAMYEAYAHLVKSLYEHWVVRGLFTREEVEQLFSSESTHSIVLQSDEIKLRLGK